MNANVIWPAVLMVVALSNPAAVGQTPTRAEKATACVRAMIEPRITVSEPEVVIISLQDHPAGLPIPSRVRFSIRANTQEVELQVACTDLYRAGDPTSDHKIPVAGPGAQVVCEQDSGPAGPGHLLAWQHAPPSGVLPVGWTGAVSETGVFATSSAGPFRHHVTVDISWRATDAELPVGEYSGFVKLVGMVHP